MGQNCDDSQALGTVFCVCLKVLETCVSLFDFLFWSVLVTPMTTFTPNYSGKERAKREASNEC